MQHILLRSIPAHAGESHRRFNDWRAVRVDPRARGGVRTELAIFHAELGRSPRTRGSRCWCSWICDAQGSIPAHAGESRDANSFSQQGKLDPNL